MEEYNVFKLICKKTSEIRTIKSFQTRSLWLFFVAADMEFSSIF